MSGPSAKIRFLNKAPLGYSHVVEARGGRSIYVSGQVSLDKEGNLVGPGNFRAQTVQVFENLNARLEEAGASFKDVVKLNYYLTDASDLQGLRDVRNRYLNTDNPPASTLVVVKQLFREEFLIEVEAIAVANE
jgi:enamine deaminase RidA (YjgF/YER057c/UK114 family)